MPPDPPLRANFVDATPPEPDELSAIEYNLNASRTDQALSVAESAGTAAGAAQSAASAASSAAGAAMAAAVAAQETAAAAIPNELKSGAAPVARVHTNSGVGAAIASGGTKLAQRTTITTGSNPEQGGVLFELVLTGYANAPIVGVSPADAQSYLTGAFPFAAAANLIQIVATSEVEPMTAYTFNTSIFGV